MLPLGRRTLGWVLVGLAALLAPVAALAWGDDFWKQKPPGEWTREEALELLQDSPWAREEFIVHPPLRGQITVGTTIGLGKCPPGSQTPCTHPATRLPDDLPGAPSRGGFLTTGYLVRWESATPVAQAFARLEELGERASAQFQAPPPRLPEDRYVITVKTTRPPASGPDLFDGLGEEELKASARLKSGQVMVAPLEVERTGVGASAAVHFFFPRTHQDPSTPRLSLGVVSDSRTTALGASRAGKPLPYPMPHREDDWSVGGEADGVDELDPHLPFPVHTGVADAAGAGFDARAEGGEDDPQDGTGDIDHGGEADGGLLVVHRAEETFFLEGHARRRHPAHKDFDAARGDVRQIRARCREPRADAPVGVFARSFSGT